MSLREEDILLSKRFLELSRRAFQRGIPSFTGFLSLHEQSLLASLAASLPLRPQLFGGLAGCERQMACFSEAREEDSAFSIACICIAPLQQRFADALSHRDVLGALMHLGIERSTMGDILFKDNRAYLFCLESIAPFILENLSQVKHTSVSCSLTKALPDMALFTLESQRIQVQSERLDGVIAKAYNLSRENSLALFRQGKVFRNGAELSNNSAQAQEGDLISVRGLGRFIYRSVEGNSRKGKLIVRIEKYV